MPTQLFSNIHDPRYRFQFERTDIATIIDQLDPPGDLLIWLPGVWAQWNRSRTTQARAERLVFGLTNERPSSRWFRGKVVWTYECNLHICRV